MIRFTNWRKSAHSNPNGSCLEAASADGMVAVQDTTEVPRRTRLEIPGTEWRRFLGTLR